MITLNLNLYLWNKTFIYLIYYDVFTDDDYLQLTLMISIAKERSMKINNDESLTR